MHMHREGESQTSPAVVPKPHLGYLNPTGNLATQGLKKGSLVVKQA